MNLLLGTHQISNVKLTVMFIERNVFHLKFGHSKEAVNKWKKYLEKVSADDKSIHVRLLTDLSGRGYTLVLEQIFETYAELEPSKCALVNRADWKAFYQEFILHCEFSERTLYELRFEC